MCTWTNLFVLWIWLPGTSRLATPISWGKLRTVGYFVLECKSFAANTYFPIQRPEGQVYSVNWKSWGGRPSLRYGIHLAAVTNLSRTRRNDATLAGYQWQPMAQQSLQLMTDIASTVCSVTTSPDKQHSRQTAVYWCCSIGCGNVKQFFNQHLSYFRNSCSYFLIFTSELNKNGFVAK